MEKENQSWIIEGFPRTRVQALSMQKIGILPDKFIVLTTSKKTIKEQVRNNLFAQNTTFFGEQLERVIDNAYEEQELHMKGVKDCFFGFTYEINADNAPQDDVLNNVAKMLRLKLNDTAPKRPPRILLLGAPGSGRSV
jgi:adenylate kinase